MMLLHFYNYVLSNNKWYVFAVISSISIRKKGVISFVNMISWLCFIPALVIQLYLQFNLSLGEVKRAKYKQICALCLILFTHLRFFFVALRHEYRKSLRCNSINATNDAILIYRERLRGYTNLRWYKLKRIYERLKRVVIDFFAIIIEDDDVVQVSNKRHKLVLDLDETLITSYDLSRYPNFDYQMKNYSYTLNPFVIQLTQNNHHSSILVLCRPFLEEFLNIVSQWYDVYIYTAANEVYAQSIIESVDQNRIIKKIFTRKDCMYIPPGHFAKDLTRITSDMGDVILIDNDQSSFMIQPDNGINISSWYNEIHDKELKYLLPLLEILQFVPDVRDVIKPSNFAAELSDSTYHSRSISQSSITSSFQTNDDNIYSDSDSDSSYSATTSTFSHEHSD